MDNIWCENCTFSKNDDSDFPCNKCVTTPGDKMPTYYRIKRESKIKDSGERQEFSTGAVRDMSEGKGDMVSIPWEAILRLSRHYENGAKKYERFNFRKGILLSSYIDSACRHIAKYQCGCDDEDHLAAAAFNVLGAMLVEEKQPELIDLPLRKDRNRFCYFEVGNNLPCG